MGEPIQTVGKLSGICGHDGSDWIKALIDAAGHLQIDVVDSGGADLKDLLDKLDDCLTALQKIDDLQNALDSVGTDELDVNVEASVAIDAQAHGHIGGAWQKQPLVFGYSGVVTERESDTDADAGLNTFTTTTVPTGEIHVILTLSAINYDNITTNLHIDINHDGNYFGVYREPNVAAGTMALVNGPIVLDAGDYIRCRFYGVTLNDSIAFDITGYKMDADL